jgi:hypothetical protein
VKDETAPRQNLSLTAVGRGAKTVLSVASGRHSALAFRAPAHESARWASTLPRASPGPVELAASHTGTHRAHLHTCAPRLRRECSENSIRAGIKRARIHVGRSRDERCDVDDHVRSAPLAAEGQLFRRRHLHSDRLRVSDPPRRATRDRSTAALANSRANARAMPVDATRAECCARAKCEHDRARAKREHVRAQAKCEHDRARAKREHVRTRVIHLAYKRQRSNQPNE